MKHFNFKESSGARLRSLLLLIAFIFVGANAKADVIPIELNETVTVATKTMWSFTAPKTGTVTLTGFFVQIFYDEAMTKEMTSDGTTMQKYNSGRGGWFNVESGVTYYLWNRSSLNAGNTFVLTMPSDDGLTLESVSPEDGSTFDVSGTGNLSIKFDVSVTYSSATLTAGTTSTSLDRQNSSSNPSMLFNLKTQLYELITSGVLNPGEEFTVTITGICATSDNTIKYGDDGTLTLTYIAPELPTYLVSSSVPETFLSYWDEGDESGKLTLTFSKELQTGATATLMYGDKDKDADGGFYNEALDVTTSGNTLTIDFTNKTRTPSTMLTNDSVYSTISVKIGNVKDIDGNTAYSNSSANTGSYSYTMPYQMVAAEDITWEWTPVKGQSLAGVDNINLWIGGDYSVLNYDGVKFTYTVDGTVMETVVDDDDITKDTSEEGELLLTIPVPDAVQTASDVYVTLNNLKNLDGVERDFTVKYNGVIVELVEPTETTLAALDDKLVIWTNAEANYVNFRIVDTSNNNEVVWTQSGMTKEYNETKGDACYVYDVFASNKLTLYKDHTYRLDFMTSEEDRISKFAVVDSSIYFYGTTLPYEYSEYTLTSIDPAPADYTIESKDEFTINVEFDGLVNINSTMAYLVDGSGSTSNFASITPTDDDATESTTYSKKWALTVSESYMSGITNYLNVSIAAEDELGRRVKGNEGTEAGSYFYYEYAASLAPDFTVIPADGSTVAKLDTIFAEYTSGIPSRNGNISDNTAIVYDANGDVVTYVGSADMYIPADKQEDYYNWKYNPTQVYMALAQPITEPGEYTLVIPSKYLILGEEMDAPNSNKMTVHYTVAALGTDFVPESISPDTVSTSTLEQLSTITLTYSEDAVVNANAEGTITVYSKTDRTAVTTGTAAADGKTVTITLAEAITAEGTYTVVVPEGLIGNAEYETSGYATGSYNAEYNLTYTVGETVVDEEVVEADPAEGVVTSLSRIVLTFPNANDVAPSYNGLEIELRDADGNKVVGATSDIDWDIEEYNKIPVELNSEITEPGTYTLHIPAGFYLLNDGSTDSKEINLTYTIEEAVDEEVVEADPAEGVVTSLSRIVLTFPNANDVAPSYNGLEIELRDADGNKVVGATSDIDWDIEEYNKIPVELNSEITEPGTYTLHIPAGFYLLNDGSTDSKEINLTYTIEETASVTLDEKDTELAVTEDMTANVTLNRTLIGGEWNTFCVPFAMTDISELGSVCEFTGATQDGDNVTMDFTTVTSIEAGKPYLVKPSNDITTMTIENASIKVAEPTAVTYGGVTLIGNYTATTVPTGAYFIYNDKVYCTDSDVQLEGFRAYITVNGSSNNAPSINVDGETTGISGVATNSGNVDIYTLSGVKVKAGAKASDATKGLQRGVYIVNGKKVVIK